MRVEMYAGYGSLREKRWAGELDILPRIADTVVLPKIETSYRVDRIVFRLDVKPPLIEITIR